MGQRTDVATQSRDRPTEKSLRSTRLNIDVPLLLVVIVLLGLGLLMMHSASWKVSMYLSKEEMGVSTPTYLFVRQLRWLPIGLAALGFCAWMDYHKWHQLSTIAMALTFVSLIAVLVIGDTFGGARRSFFDGSVQPSELAKFVIVIYLAVWLYAKRNDLGNLSLGLIPLMFIVGGTSGLILGQPDKSAAAMITLLGFLMYYLADSDALQIFLMVVGALVVTYVMLVFNPLGINQVDNFKIGWEDVVNLHPHVKHAVVAFYRGGWIGVGVGNGSTKLTTLPNAHTDSVFAVVGEETGVFGASILVILYGLLFWRGLVIAHRAPDGLGSLLAAGLTMWITLEAYMNMASLLNLMPFAGNALPFFSVGGSNLVTTMAAIGVVLNVSRLSEGKQQENSRRSFSAIVDLRGRDRRGRVSRAGRSRANKR